MMGVFGSGQMQTAPQLPLLLALRFGEARGLAMHV